MDCNVSFSFVFGRSEDFVEEARNSERTANNLKSNKYVKVPQIYWDLTSSQVLTMQFCSGHKETSIELVAIGDDGIIHSVCEQPVFGMIKDLAILQWNEKFQARNIQVLSRDPCGTL